MVLEHAEDGQGAGNAGQEEIENVDQFTAQRKYLLKVITVDFSRFLQKVAKKVWQILF